MRKLLVLCAACAFVASTLFVGTVLVNAARSTGGALAAATHQNDHVRCNLGVYNSAGGGSGARERNVSYCYFVLETGNAQNPPGDLVSAGTYSVASSYDHAGPNVYSTATCGNGSSSCLGFHGGYSVSDRGTWYVGPSYSFAGVALGVGQAVFESNLYDADISPGEGGEIINPGCSISGVNQMNNSLPYGCKGNFLGYAGSLTDLNAIGWDGLDWFPGNAPHPVTPPDFCAGLGVHVNFYDNTYPAGSSFQLVLTSSVPVTSDVVLRSHWLDSTGGVLRHDVAGAVITVPTGSSPWTIPVPTRPAFGSVIPHYDWFLSCTSSTTFATYLVDGTGYVTRGARTCDAIASAFRWPPFPLQPSTVSTMGLSIPAGVVLLDAAGITALAWSDWTDPAAVVTTSITTIRNELGIIRSFPVHQGDGITFDIASPAHVVSKDNFALSCTDSSGVRVWPAGNKPNPENVFHPINEEVIGPRDAADRYSACMDDLPSMQLTDPGSWVAGIAGMAMCLFQLVFVPTSAGVEYLKSAAIAATTHAPISYVSQGATFMYGAVTNAPASVLAHRGDSLTLFGGGVVPGQAPITGNFSALGAAMTTPRMIMGVLFWLGSVWTLFAMTMRRIRP